MELMLVPSCLRRTAGSPGTAGSPHLHAHLLRASSRPEGSPGGHDSGGEGAAERGCIWGHDSCGGAAERGCHMGAWKGPGVGAGLGAKCMWEKLRRLGHNHYTIFLCVWGGNGALPCVLVSVSEAHTHKSRHPRYLAPTGKPAWPESSRRCTRSSIGETNLCAPLAAPPVMPCLVCPAAAGALPSPPMRHSMVCLFLIGCLPCMSTLRCAP